MLFYKRCVCYYYGVTRSNDMIGISKKERIQEFKIL